MTTNGTSKSDPLTYRRLSTVCFLLAAIALFVGSIARYLYVGIAVYATLCIAGFGVRHTASVTLFDERDKRSHDRASGSTINIISYVGLVSVPVVLGLSVAGYLSLPPEWYGFVMAFPALMAVYVVVSAYHRYR